LKAFKAYISNFKSTNNNNSDPDPGPLALGLGIGLVSCVLGTVGIVNSVKHVRENQKK
jgi:hypothetical protein